MPDPLDLYRKKRSAGRTAEPFHPVDKGARPLSFVVQKHAARRLHYDLRLEHEGVLWSWAVPQGPSPDPKEKRFAAQTEDHPVNYSDYEGVISEGEYGAGPMIVWDRGSYVPLEDMAAGMQKGKLLFELRGHKLRGVWTLVRMKSGTKDWLLIKHKDAWSSSDPPPYREESIFSGLTVEELARAEEHRAAIRAQLVAAGAKQAPVALATLEPMLAESVDAPFSKKGWLFELKVDGFRMLAEKKAAHVGLRYRRKNDATDLYPDLRAALLALPYDVVLDGEVCVLDDEGKPRFQKLQARALLSRTTEIERAAVTSPATFFVFDLLAFDGLDLRDLPLATRKDVLKRLLPPAGPVRYVDHVEERGEDLYRAVRAMGLEGVVGKKADAPYRGRRSDEWRKVRGERTGDFVVVGFTVPESSGRVGFGALHLAVPRGGTLAYAGRVGTGFDDALLASLRARMDGATVDAPPCTGAPKGREHRWVRPDLVVEVAYLEWTDEKYLRHPVFQRVRDDKRPDDCAVDDVEAPIAVEAAPPTVDVVLEKKVPFSNLTKVFWPDDGVTKGDLIEYYRAISPWLLPYLKDRPVVLTRYPDGIGGKSFFQKDAPPFVPPWLRTTRMWSEQAEREIDAFVVEDVESLLYLVNLGTIPLHIWSSRIATLQRPDWTSLDLDPKSAPFRDVVVLAKSIRALCDRIGLPSFAKTTGSSGIHVLVPLGGRLTHDQAKSLGELLARVVVQQHPDIATVERVVEARGGKVYVDFLQNGHGRLLAAPFCARPVPGAPVSMPLKWSEVNGKLTPRKFTVKDAPARMKKLKVDPNAGVLTEAPDLARVLAALSALV